MTRSQPPVGADPEDLGIRARHGTLSEAERLAWERARSADPMLIVAHQVGLDFDRVGLVQSGDDQLVARMADLALARARPRARFGGARRRFVLAFAAALTVAGSAAAWRGSLLRLGSPVAAGSTAQATQSLPATRLKSRAPLPTAAQTPSASVETSASAAVETSAAAPGSIADGARAAVLPVRAAEDASALFREAAAARRSSDFGRARLLYLRLESEFKASAEARLAPVSLGKVLLLMGRASEAEQQFSLYSRAGGTLTEEALVGQAQSLARLGRSADEQRVWQRLLRDFPHSVYAAEANQRLLLLGASDAR